MNEIKPSEYEEFGQPGTRRSRKLKKRRYPRGRTYALREQKKAERSSSKEKRRSDAAKKLKKQLQRFPDIDTEEGKDQLEMYLEWLHESREQGFPSISESDIEFTALTASVKAGGQKRQKTKSAVRAIHLPTLIRVKQEGQREQSQNKSNAMSALYELLNTHLNLWKELVGNSNSFDEIEKKAGGFLKELGSK